MFGYLVADQSQLTQAQKDRYKGCYCGLCAALKSEHGFFGRMALTYDMTFLVLLLSAMYEPQEARRMEICVAHPVRKHFCWETDYTHYAADMNVALAYYNCLDDFEDDGSVIGFWESEFLKSQYEAVRSRYPRQCEAIEQCLSELGEMESADVQNPDAAAACFGALMGELFCTGGEYDHFLRPFGDALGRLIYLLDAVMDLEEDVKKNRYNPLKALRASGMAPGDGRVLITTQLGAVADAFERLPLLQDADLMRNILYTGVWQRYNRAAGRSSDQEEQHEGPV